MIVTQVDTCFLHKQKISWDFYSFLYNGFETEISTKKTMFKNRKGKRMSKIRPCLKNW